MSQPVLKKIAFVTFANHFDLVWRRCWERAYEYEGARYASYSDVETAVMDEALALAEAGRGAYQVEQVLTIRMYLRRRPDALPRLRRLYKEGLFEVFGAGEAIIDVNLCRFETMARNLASGTRFCRDVLGMPPVLATHCDGFGSSAQFPQVIRGCGYRAVEALSYSVPDNDYWRGLDGSTVYVWKNWPGRNLFYDHCYHEPCLVCHGHGIAGGCPDCQGTGFDLPQNFYPPFLPLEDKDFKDGLAHYAVTSEEMLPPAYMGDVIRQWNAAQSEIHYQWGTHRNLTALLAAGMALADAPPADRLASRVENNATQTGCLVTRIRAKQGAARCESIYYSTEAAVAATLFADTPAPYTAAAWHELFLELPLFYFHDSVTGTHQDDAARELLDRMAAHETQVADLGCAIVAGRNRSATPADAAPGRELRVFNPRAEDNAPLRIPLPVKDWRQTGPLVAETPDGRRFPVTLPWHRFSPPVPLGNNRLINAVGSGTRARPAAGEAFIEASGLAPLAWTSLTLREASPPQPQPASTRELANSRFRIQLGDHGIEEIADLRTGSRILAEPDFPIGALRLDEDEGDPWNSRKLDSFKHALAPFTRLLGTAKFDGYSEAWYGGVYEPNLPFGHEQDPMIFALEWFVTIRLLDEADRIDFHYELFWKTANRRVRMVFPTQAASDTGWYSIPGGWLQRERHDQKDTVLWSPNGDWPAQNFVATEGPHGSENGWAVIHYGTPAARIEDGRILISPLRSPAFGHCLERYAQRYPMPTSGIRDPGWHHVTLSLLPHAGQPDMPRLARTANALTARPMAVSPLPTDQLSDAGWPRLTSTHVELTACKLVFLPAPAGIPANAVVLRLLNLSDSPAEANLTAQATTGVRLQECDLLEQPSGPASELPAGTTASFNFTPFQVRSFLVWREEDLSLPDRR